MQQELYHHMISGRDSNDNSSLHTSRLYYKNGGGLADGRQNPAYQQNHGHIRHNNKVFSFQSSTHSPNQSTSPRAGRIYQELMEPKIISDGRRTTSNMLLFQTSQKNNNHNTANY